MVCTPARVRCRLHAENKRLTTGRPHRTVHSYILRDAALLCQVGAIVPCYYSDHVAAITEGRHCPVCTVYGRDTSVGHPEGKKQIGSLEVDARIILKPEEQSRS